MLTFSDPSDFNHLKLGICLLLRQFNVEFSSSQAPSWISLSLKFPQFCCLGRHCFGKVPQCSPYWLQVINPSVSRSLAWLCLLAQHPPRGEPSFPVTRFHVFWSQILNNNKKVIQVLRLLNQTWVCSLNTQQSQSTDTQLWWRYIQCLLQGQTRRIGSSCSKDPKYPMTFRGGFFFKYKFILFIYFGCVGSSLLHAGSL